MAQKLLVIAHYRVGVSTQATLRGVKHFNRAPTTVQRHSLIIVQRSGSAREMKTSYHQILR